MRSWTEWEITRHQVALYGYVRHANERPAGGARVTLADRGGKARASGKQANVRSQTTSTRPNGLYFFFNLRPGTYALLAECEGEGGQATVQTNVPAKPAQISVADIKILIDNAEP